MASAVVHKPCFVPSRWMQTTTKMKMIQTCLEEGKEKEDYDSLALLHRKNLCLIQVSHLLKKTVFQHISSHCEES